MNWSSTITILLLHNFLTLAFLAVCCRYEIFADSKHHGVEPIQVEQATWGEITSVVSYPDVGVQCELKRAANPHPGTSQERNRTIIPHFILMRSVTRSVGHLDDRNKLYALKHGNV